MIEPARLVTFEVREQRPDVLVVTNAWPHSEDRAYGIFIERQVRSLQELGIRFDVMFIRGYLSQTAYGVAMAELARLSRAGEPAYQLVHGHGGETGPSVAGYRRAPRLLSYLGDDLLGTPRADGFVPLSSRIRRGILRRTALLMSRTITKSGEMQGVLPRSCQRRNDVIPNGVDETVFAPRPQSEARRALGWDPEAKVILFGGSPKIPRKRFWLAEQATAKASASVPNVQLEILESVPPATVPAMMSAADCLLLPSAIEGSPNVVKEALMCNLPVVATPVGDVEELLSGVSPSWICEPVPDQIAAALVECLSEPTRSDGRLRSGHLTAAAIGERVRSAYAEATRARGWDGNVDLAS